MKVIQILSGGKLNSGRKVGVRSGSEPSPQLDAAALSEVIAVLRRGGLVIFPTETTYGAGVLATSQEGVDTLLKYKSRREGKPLSIAVADDAMAGEYVQLNDQARTLYRQFLPGPVTVVSRGLGRVARGVESEFGTLGVRIPDYELVLQLVGELGAPITATSANASGKKRPYTIKDILNNLSDKQKSLIDLVIDAGELPHNPPSTVIDTTLSTLVTLREGDIRISLDKSIPIEVNSVEEMHELAGRIMLQHWNEVRKRGLVLGLDGALGTGKTVFSNGVAHFLHLPHTLTSPTYSYVEEYSYERHGATGKLYHWDVWKIDSQDMFERMEFERCLQPGSVVIVEWWNQVEPWAKAVVDRSGCAFLPVLISDTGETTRKVVLGK